MTFSPAVRVVSDLPSCGFFYRYVLTQKVEASWPSSLHLDICSDCRCFGPAGSSLAIALIPETRTLVAATHCWGRTLRWPRIPSAAQGGGEYSKMPLVLSYATETGLSSARVGRSLAHARLITRYLNLKGSFARKLSDSLTTNNSEKTKCEQVYVKMHYDYSSRVVSNALLIFETSIAWPLTWVNKSHASSCSTGFFHL